jgi:glutamate formiminotransferase
MNLLDYTKTPIHRAYELVRLEAERYGVSVVASEIIGLVPLDALLGVVDHYLRLSAFTRDQVLEARLLEE